MRARRRERFDLIVVGVGGMGAALLERASAAGHQVLGLERGATLRASAARSRASSRGFRQTYAEARLADWAARSRAYWVELGARSGRELFVPSGATLTAPLGHEALEAVRRSADRLGTACETLSESAHRARLGSSFPPRFETLWEPQAGWIKASEAVSAMAQLAVEQGAVIECSRHVVEVHDGGASARARCEDGLVYEASWIALCSAGGEIAVFDRCGELRRHEPWRCRRQVEHSFEVPEALAERLGMFHLIGLEGSAQGGEVLYGITESAKRLKCCSPRSEWSVEARDPGRFEAPSREEAAQAHGSLIEAFGELALSARHRGARCGWSVARDDDTIRCEGHPGCDRVYEARAFCGHGFKMFPAMAEHLLERMSA